MTEYIEMKTLLLVEDEVLIGLAKKRQLQDYNYNVLLAHSGEKALEMVFGEDEIDLILMDIDLGRGIDGTEAAEIILKEKEMPILFLSNHTETEIVNRTEKITSYGYVIKNSNITVLNASIKMAFKLFEAQRRIKESELRYQQLFEYDVSGIGLHKIIFNSEGEAEDYVFIEVNKAFETHTGLKRDDIIGRKVTEVIPGIRESSFIETYGKVVRTGEAVSFEQYSEPLKRHYSISAYKIADDQFATVFSDITDRKKAEQKLVAYYQNLERLVEKISNNVNSKKDEVSGLEKSVESSNPWICEILNKLQEMKPNKPY